MDAIELTIDPRARPVGSGTVRRLLPFRSRRMVGPFTFLDIMGPEDFGPGVGMDVDAHPHIGLSTLTYLLAGRIEHRDSTGAVQTIEPGAVNWMTAGRGVTHTERTLPEDRAIPLSMFGVQIWVALPDEAEDGPPQFEHCAASDVPEHEVGTSRIRVAAGSGWGLDAPIAGSSPLLLAEVAVSDVAVDVPDLPERAVLALDGDIRVNDRPLPAGSLAVLERGVPARVSGAGTALVLGGEPVGKRHIWWNFVHSDPDRIDDAKQRWIDQRFPVVPDDHDVYVPLPGS
jgi:redox-sensitive bicupin YhaK (pirin superfamily)